MKSEVLPTILIIVGITGDLSTRKLLPAIEQIVKAGAAPEKFKVVGVTRRDVSKDEVLATAKGAAHDFLAQNLTMYQMDVSQVDDYVKFSEYLTGIEQAWQTPAQRLYYLSVPPQVSRPIVQRLGESGLSKIANTKLLLEKPFGTDLASAQDLVHETMQHFSEDQIYRIDHYLAKEMAQNLLVFREGNALFKRTWNKDFIERIDIVAAEEIGIEGRAAFYEQTGALRDLVQSHLLQLVALTLMEPPAYGGALEDVRQRRLHALQQLRISPTKPLSEVSRRAQYEGYRQEVGNPHSCTETYVQLTLESTDPNWEGVVIRLLTGKALVEKTTKICITYKKDDKHEADQLIITLQPNEGVELHLWTKVPGYEWKTERYALGLLFKDHFPLLPEAYEQVLVDAINSNHTLFTNSDEVLETWRIIAPLQKDWSMCSDDPEIYPVGSDLELGR